MLRLTRKGELERTVTLQVEGRLVLDWAPLLEREVEALLTTFQSVRLDLAQVAYVDGDGRETLKRLLSRRIEIVNCPPLILQILAIEGAA